MALRSLVSVLAKAAEGRTLWPAEHCWDRLAAAGYTRILKRFSLTLKFTFLFLKSVSWIGIMRNV